MNEDARKKIEDLFHRYGAGVGRYVLLRVGDPELAEEITARVFLGVVRNFHQQKGSPVGWLWSIVRTELARLSRAPVHAPLPADLATPPTGSGDVLERQERSRLLHAALRKLSDDAHQLVSLKFFLGLSNLDIAQATGLTPSNVGVKLHRALKELRELLSLPLTIESTPST